MHRTYWETGSIWFNGHRTNCDHCSQHGQLEVKLSRGGNQAMNISLNTYDSGPILACRTRRPQATLEKAHTFSQATAQFKGSSTSNRICVCACSYLRSAFLDPAPAPAPVPVPVVVVVVVPVPVPVPVVVVVVVVAVVDDSLHIKHLCVATIQGNSCAPLCCFASCDTSPCHVWTDHSLLLTRLVLQARHL